jgi:hypothetical protein
VLLRENIDGCSISRMATYDCMSLCCFNILAIGKEDGWLRERMCMQYGRVGLLDRLAKTSHFMLDAADFGDCVSYEH